MYDICRADMMELERMMDLKVSRMKDDIKRSLKYKLHGKTTIKDIKKALEEWVS